MARLVPVDDEAPKQPEVNGSFGRQLGLSVRAPVRGAMGTIGLLSDPIATTINLGLDAAGAKAHVPTATAMFDQLWQAAGLPVPATGIERVAGEAAELMTPGAAIPKLAEKGARMIRATAESQPVKAAIRSGLEMMGQKPALQAASAAASGAAGAADKEAGGDAGSNFMASLAAGVAAPYAIGKGQAAGNAVRNTIERMATPPNVAVDVTINNVLRNSGIEFGQLPQQVQNSIRNDVSAALNSGGQLSPDAVRRLADYRLTGLTPRTGNLTLDPVEITQQQNLAKQGANSKDPAAQRLSRVQNDNNTRLIGGLNTLGANTADDAYAGGQRIIGALENRIGAVQGRINQRYEQARATDGRSAFIDPHAFTNSANDALDAAMVGGKLPADVRNHLNRIAAGQTPLTVDVAEQLKTVMGQLSRNSGDGQERMALGLVRRALDDAPLLDGQGQQAIDAFNRARRLNRTWETVVERTPALAAVRDGMEPDKFVQQFIVGNGPKTNTMDLAMLQRAVRSQPEAIDAVKTQILAHLKNKALSGAADEVGKFSQSNFNKALLAIGERKLGMFFSPEEIQQLQAIGRVASYEQVQPVGAAVNNSNTAGTVIGMLERVANSPLIRRIPLGQQMLAQPAENIVIGSRSTQALQAPRALALPMPMQQPAGVPAGLLLSPMILKDEQEKRRGLLSP